MAKRSSPGQTNFFSLLAPPCPLNPNIVTPSDPRFPQALEELRTAKYFGFDLEYYGPWTQKKDIDHTKAIIRLIQVGLPSGLAILVDLGGIHDNRAQHLEALEPFLSVLQPALASRTQLKVGQSLKGDLVALEFNLGFRVRAVRDLMLFSQVLWAGVGAAKPKKPKGRQETSEERQRRLKFVGLRHNLQSIAQRTGHEYKEPSEDKYTGAPYWSGKLGNEDLNLAAEKSQIVLPVWRKIAQWVKEADLIDSVMAECDALPAFAECEIHGLPVDWNVLESAIKAWSAARDKVLAVWKETFPTIDPLKKEKVAVALSNKLELHGDDRLYSLGEPGKNGKRKIIPRVNDESLVPYDSITPGNQDVDPARRKIYEAVHAFLEHNSIFVQLKYLEGFRKRYHKGYVRPKFFQIAMGDKAGKEGETGKGMGRSSASNPNTQNSPNLQPSHKAAGLPHPRSVVRPGSGRSFIVADLSAAHARIATEVSADPVLIDIFNSGKDVHCVTAHGLLSLKGHAWDYDQVFGFYLKHKAYSKALEKGQKPDPISDECFEVKATRDISKNVFYGSINIQGAPTLKKTAETGAEPVFMTIEQAAEGIALWRSTYSTLHAFQRQTIRDANRFNVHFDQSGIGPYSLNLPGTYAVVRGPTKRRLFLLKEEDKHGRVSCKGTDCVSFVWMGAEADIMKRAMGRIQAEFDQHPEWGAHFCSMCHDELDVECLKQWEAEVAQVVQREMDAAMQWVIKVIPVSDGDWKSMIVGSWAAK